MIGDPNLDPELRARTETLSTVVPVVLEGRLSFETRGELGAVPRYRTSLHKHRALFSLRIADSVGPANGHSDHPALDVRGACPLGQPLDRPQLRRPDGSLSRCNLLNVITTTRTSRMRATL